METRVVTIVGATGDEAGAVSLLAENLATELAYAGRTVMLADAGSGQCSSWIRARMQARMRPRMASTLVRAEGCGEFLAQAAGRFDHTVIDAGAAPVRSTLCALIASQVAVVVIDAGTSDADRIAILSARLREARLFNPALRVLCAALYGDAEPGVDALQRLRAGAALLGSACVASTSLQLKELRFASTIPGQCSRDRQESASPFTSLWREIAPLPARRLGRQFFKQ